MTAPIEAKVAWPPLGVSVFKSVWSVVIAVCTAADGAPKPVGAVVVGVVLESLGAPGADGIAPFIHPPAGESEVPFPGVVIVAVALPPGLPGKSKSGDPLVFAFDAVVSEALDGLELDAQGGVKVDAVNVVVDGPLVPLLVEAVVPDIPGGAKFDAVTVFVVAFVPKEPGTPALCAPEPLKLAGMAIAEDDWVLNAPGAVVVDGSDVLELAEPLRPGALNDPCDSYMPDSQGVLNSDGIADDVELPPKPRVALDSQGRPELCDVAGLAEELGMPWNDPTWAVGDGLLSPIGALPAPAKLMPPDRSRLSSSPSQIILALGDW